MKYWYGLVFLLGIVLGFGISLLAPLDIGSLTGLSISGFVVSDVGAPSDWVSEDDIIVLDDRVILKVGNATLSNYADSGSMKPVFDVGANGIRVVPGSEVGVGVGDIVSFYLGDSLIVHRVVEKGVDGDGVYFVTMGDNGLVDDGKVRFEQIEYVTIGVIW